MQNKSRIKNKTFGVVLSLSLLFLTIISPANAAITSDISVTQNPDGSVTFSWDGAAEEYLMMPQNGNVLHVCLSDAGSCLAEGEDSLEYFFFMSGGETSLTIQENDADSGGSLVREGFYVAQMVIWISDEEEPVGSLADFTIGSPVSNKSPIIANGYRVDALGSVYFAPGSSKLSKAARDQIKNLVLANPTAIFKVTGYVQKSGTSVNDAKLSLARAKAVESYLISLGAGVNFTVVVETGLVPAKEGSTSKARKATLFAMTPVVQ